MKALGERRSKLFLKVSKRHASLSIGKFSPDKVNVAVTVNQSSSLQCHRLLEVVSSFNAKGSPRSVPIGRGIWNNTKLIRFKREINLVNTMMIF